MVEYKRREVFEINLKVVKACVYDTLHKLYVVVVVGYQLVLSDNRSRVFPEQRGIWTYATEQWDLLLRDGKILFCYFVC